MANGLISHSTNGSTLGDILERILDKGVVVAGDISISLCDIELLTIRIRLVVASIDKAAEMGIDWWRTDPYLSSQAKKQLPGEETKSLEEENKQIVRRLESIESKLSALKC